VDFELPPLDPSPDASRLPAPVVAVLMEQARACRDTGLLLEQARLLERRSDVDLDDSAGTGLLEAVAHRRYRAVLELVDTLEWVFIDAATSFASNVTRAADAVLRHTMPEVTAELDGTALLRPETLPLVQFGGDRDLDLRRAHHTVGGVLAGLANSGDPLTLLTEQGRIGEPWIFDLGKTVHAYGHLCSYVLAGHLTDC
jgi:hypothetical protein